jgi:signal transduction histidine kinase
VSEVPSRDRSRRAVFGRLAAEWNEIGGLGRLAVVGILASAVLAVALGFSITSAARGHLLDARAEIVEIIVEDLVPLYEGDPDMEPGGVFDEAVRERLLGGETVQVKVWLPDGSIAYSDDIGIVGRRFTVSAPAREAFAGSRSSRVSDLSDPAHAEHVDLGSLIEFYLPFVLADDGEVLAVFEVEQRTDRLEAALGRMERNVWISIGSGLGVLGLFLGALGMARARDLNRRRRRAEALLGALLTAQEEERTRIVGALHDDVGQRLYRLLYGIEGTRDRMSIDDPLREQMDSLTGITREIDTALRAELRTLHQGVLGEIGLEGSLRALVDTVRAESGLTVDLDVALDREPDEVRARILARAAGEALTNVRRHAAAGHAAVRLELAAGRIVLTVTDDGRGIDAEPGLGLTTTRERLEAIDGSLTVSSRPGGGTVFVASVPLRGAE